MQTKTKLQLRSLLNCSAEEVSNWHLRPCALERSFPPTDQKTFISTEGRPNVPGSRFSIRTKIFGPFSSRLVFQYDDFIPNEGFSSHCIEGIFSHYLYQIKITPQNEYISEIVDMFEFQINVPRFFTSYVTRIFQKRLTRHLSYKHDVLQHDIELLNKYPCDKSLKVLVSGGDGLIGKSLTYFLEFFGHEVWHLSRKESMDQKTILWDPKKGEYEAEALEGFDVVVHLAGENIGKGRWTKKKKEKILKSRIKGTEFLVECLGSLKAPPKTLICASAVGIYGERGNAKVDESAAAGQKLFITDVCEKWERATKDLAEKGVRIVNARFGAVLSLSGGTLKKLLPLFKYGLGGTVGRGKQYMSWIALDDALSALYHIMMTEELKGPVNVTAPEPVTNRIFSKKLSKRLSRWLAPPIPEFLIQLIMGQKGEELLLTSTRAIPQKLLDSGYHFQYSDLTHALEHLI